VDRGHAGGIKIGYLKIQVKYTVSIVITYVDQDMVVINTYITVIRRQQIAMVSGFAALLSRFVQGEIGRTKVLFHVN
jgi:hypothetical protein